MEITWEHLPGGLRLCVSDLHRFGTDAFLLSDFAAPRPGDIVCDLGSGCGIVAALWFRDEMASWPGRAYGVEVQQSAWALMDRSLKEGGLPKERFVPVLADLRDRETMSRLLPQGGIDLVTCNPPYKGVGRGLLSGTEAERIARHELLCTPEDLCEASRRLLRHGGRLCVCQRPERLADMMEAMRRHRIEPKRLRFVHRNPARPPWLFLLEGRLGGKPFLKVEAPLLMEGPGGFSSEVLRIYRKEKNHGG